MALAKDKTAIEAIKLLIPLAGEVSEELDPVLEALTLDDMEQAYGRAIEYINSITGDSGEDGLPSTTAVLGAEVLSALRGTKHADLRGGAASLDNNGGPGTAGGGDNSIPDN